MHFSTNTRSAGLLLAILLLIALEAPLHGQIRSVRLRVYGSAIGSDAINIDVQKFAKITAGRIINTEMVRGTVKNGSEPTYTRFEISVNIDSGAWGGGYMDFSITKPLASNETFTLINTRIADYLDLIEMDVMAIDQASHVDGFDDFLDLKIPEGDYSIDVVIYEVDDAEGSNKQWKASESLSFKLVDIDSLGLVETPSPNSRAIAWQLPQIPIYTDISAITTSILSIRDSSDGEIYRAEFAHDPPFGSGLKGFPTGSNLSDGLFEYDLDAAGVVFRVGETYTIYLSYEDWGGDEIGSLRESFEYPVEWPDLTAPSGNVDSFLPTFEWSYRDYADLVSSYELVIDGERTVNVGSATSYSLSEALPISQDFTWYVIPYYSDGRPFFSSVPSGYAQTFTTPGHDRMDVSVSFPTGGEVLKVGESYTFDGDVTLYDNASLQSWTWHIGGNTYSGRTATYTPDRRNDPLTVYAEVTDSLGLTRNTPQTQLTVKDPQLSIASSVGDTTEAGQPANFRVSNATDIDSLVWKIDGREEYYDSDSISHSFSTLGDHSVVAEGFTTALDGSGSATEISVSSNSLELMVYDPDSPEISIGFPNQGDTLFADTDYSFSATVSSANTIDSVDWRFGNTTRSGTSLTDIRLESGSQTISCTAIDIYGQSNSVSISVEVVSPQLSITFPDDQASFALNKSVDFQVQKSGVSNVTWEVNGTRVSDISNYRFSNAGTQEIGVSGTATGRDGNGAQISRTFTDTTSITIIDSDPPTADIEFPPEGATLFAGATYEFAAVVTAEAPPYESLWHVNGETRSGDSVTYTPSASDSGTTLTVEFVVSDAAGLSTRKTRSVTVVDPTLSMTSPTSGETFSRTESITFSAAAQELDFVEWLLDGQVAAQGISFSDTIGTLGPHTIQARGRVSGTGPDGATVTRTVESEVIAFDIIGALPSVDISGVANGARLLAGRSYTVTASVSAENGDTFVEFHVPGGTQTGETITFTPSTRGDFTIRAEATDRYNLTGFDTLSVRGVDPAVTITSLSEGSNVAVGVATALGLSGRDLDGFQWYVDGVPVSVTGTYRFDTTGSTTVSVDGKATVTDSNGAQETITVSDSVTVNVVDSTPPSIDIISPQPETTLFDGDRYRFAADVTSPNGVSQVTWTINGQTFDEEVPTYQAAASAGSTMDVVVNAVDSIGIPSTYRYSVTVVSPRLTIQSPGESETFDTGTSVQFLAYAQALDGIRWYIDGQQFASGPSAALQVSEVADHVIRVEGVAYGIDRNGDDAVKTYSDAVGIRVKDSAPPQISVGFPLDGYALFAGETYSFSSTAESNNGVSETYWVIDGNRYGNPASFTPVEADSSLDVSFVATDRFGDSSEYDFQGVIVQNPEVSITSPATSTVTIQDAVGLSASSTGVDRLSWYVNDAQVDPGIRFRETGDYTIRLEGETTGRAADGSVESRAISATTTISVIDSNPPEVFARFPQSGYTLFVGTNYSFQVDASSDNGIQSILWTIDGQEYTGSSITYVPRVPRPEGFPARVTVTDTTGLSSTQTLEVITKAPRVDVTLPATSVYDIGERIAISATTTDVDTVRWVLDGQEISSGSQLSYAIDSPGSYTLQARGETYGYDADGTRVTRSAVSEMITFQVKDPLPPAATITSPADGARLLVGTQYQFLASATSANSISETYWNVNEERKSGATVAYTPTVSGELNASFTAVDAYQVPTEVSIANLHVVDPEVQITGIEDGKTVLRNDELSLVASSQDVDSVQWQVDGVDVSAGSFLFEELGERVLSVTGTVSVLTGEGTVSDLQVSDRRTIRVIDGTPPVVDISFPPEGALLRTGEEYQFSAQSSSPNRIQETYWEIEGKRYAGSSFPYIPANRSSSGGITVTHTVVDEFGIAVNEKRTVSVVNPRLRVSAPTQGNTFLSGQRVDLVAEAEDVDRIEWTVNGTVVADGEVAYAVIRTPGTATVQPTGVYVATQQSGDTVQQTIQGNAVDLSIADPSPPGISQVSPPSGSRLFAGMAYTFSAQAESANGIERTYWTIEGQQKDGNTVVHSFDSSGPKTVAFEAVDRYDQPGKRSIAVEIVDPRLELTSVSDGSVYYLMTEPDLTAEAEGFDSLVWTVNGAEVDPGDYDFPGVGGYEISVVGEVQALGVGGVIERRTYRDSAFIRMVDDQPPRIAIDEAFDGAPLFAGTAYQLTVDVESKNPIGSVYWTVDGTRYRGADLEFIPRERFPNDSLIIRAYAVDDRGLESFDEITVTVADPTIDIAQPEFGSYHRFDQDLTLSASSQDADYVRWFVNGSFIGQSDSLSYRSAQIGSHSIQAEAVTRGLDGQGNAVLRRTRTPEIPIVTVSLQRPEVQPVYTLDGGNLFVGERYELGFTATSTNGIDKEEIRIAGTPYAGSSYGYVPNTRGSVQIQLLAYDRFQGKSPWPHAHTGSYTMNATVIDPQVTIANLSEGQVFGIGENVDLQGTATDVKETQWLIEGAMISGDTHRFDSTGEYEVTLRGVQSGFDGTGAATVRSVSDSRVVRVVDLAPPRVDISLPVDGSRFLVGEDFDLSGNVESSNDLSRTWWEVDGSIVAVGADPSSATIGDVSDAVEISYHAKDVEGLVGSAAVQVSAVSPSLRIVDPAAGGTYLQGSQIRLDADEDAIDRVRWYAGDELIAEGSVAYTSIDSFGPISITATGTTTVTDAQGEQFEHEVRSISTKVTVRDVQNPHVQLVSPSTNLRLFQGVSYTFQASATSNNELARVQWNFGESTSRNGVTVTYVPDQWGSLPITVRVYDVYELVGTDKAVAEVIKPELEIARPAAGTVMAVGEILDTSLRSVDVENITWYLDDTQIDPNGYTFDASGEYVLRVAASASGLGSDGSPKTRQYGDRVLLTVENEEPPRVDIDFPQGGTALLAGQEYQFVGEVSSTSDVADVWWIIEGRRYAGSELSLRLLRSARDSEIELHALARNGLEAADVVRVDILEPSLGIRAPVEGSTVSKDRAVPLEAAFSDVQRVTWHVNDQQVGSGPNLLYTFTSTGRHAIEARAQIGVDVSGRTTATTISSEPVLINVKSEVPPAVKIQRDDTAVPLLRGLTYAIPATVLSENPLAEIQWFVNGKLQGELSQEEMEESSAGEVGLAPEISADSRGSLSVVFRATDIYQRSDEFSVTYQVIEPGVSFVEPGDETGAVYTDRDGLKPELAGRDLEVVTLYLNDEEIAPEIRVRELGSHTLRAEAHAQYREVDWSVGERSYQSEAAFQIIDADPPNVQIEFPPDESRLFHDTDYVFRGVANSPNGIAEVWWSVAGRRSYEGDESFAFRRADVDESGEIEVTFHAKDDFDVTNSRTISVSVLDPNLDLTNPVEEQVFDSGNLVELSARANDLDDLIWFLDDSEIAQGSSTVYRVQSTGLQHIRARGTVKGLEPDGSEVTRAYESRIIPIQVKDPAPPTISLDFPKTNELLFQDQNYSFQASIASNNEIARTLWSIDERTIESTGRAPSFTPQRSERGTHTVSVEVVDVFGNRSAESVVYRVLDPVLKIISPIEGQVYGIGNVVGFLSENRDIRDVTWLIDGQEIDPQGFFFDELGEHTITGVGSIDGTNARGEVVTRTVRRTVDVQSIASEPPSITFEGDYDGAALLAGTEYTLRAHAESDNGIDRVWWEVNETETVGDTLVFAPSRRYVDEPLTLQVYARDSFGLVKEREIELSVLDPMVTLRAPVSGSKQDLKRGDTVRLHANARDVNPVVEVNGAPISAENYVLDSVGSVIVRAVGSVEVADGNFGVRTVEYRSEPAEIRVYSQDSPSLDVRFPESQSTLLLGQKYTLAVSVRSENRIRSVSWVVTDGPVDPMDTSVVAQGSGNTLDFTPQEKSEYYVTLTATDVFGQSSRRNMRLQVVDPILTISSPVNGHSHVQGREVELSYESKDLYGIEWLHNGETIESGAWVPESTGSHNITVRGYVNASADSGATQGLEYDDTVRIRVIEATPPNMRIESLSDNDRLLVGATYNLVGSAENANGVAEEWWVVDGNRLGNSSSIEWSPQRRGQKRISYHASDALGLTASRQVTVEVIDPRVAIRSPLPASTRVYRAGAPVSLTYHGTDIDTVDWFLDEAPLTGASHSFNAGSHVLRLAGRRVVRDADGTYQEEVVSDSVTVVAKAPVQINDVELGTSTFYVGGILEAQVRLSNGDGVAELDHMSWYVNDRRVSREPGPLELNLSGYLPGTHTLRVAIRDELGSQASLTKEFVVVPEIETRITQPAPRSVLRPQQDVFFTAEIGDDQTRYVDRYGWTMNGHNIDDAGLLSGVGENPGAGEHQLALRVVDAVGNIVRDSIDFSVGEDFYIDVQTPEAGRQYSLSETITGVAVPGRATANENVRYDSGNLTWIVNGSEYSRGGTVVLDLPAGAHEISLVYDDGTVDYETEPFSIAVASPRQTRVISPSQDATIVWGSEAPIFLEAEGEPEAIYDWYVDGSFVRSGQTAVWEDPPSNAIVDIEVRSNFYGHREKSWVSATVKENTPPLIDWRIQDEFVVGQTVDEVAVVTDGEDNDVITTLLLDGVQVETPIEFAEGSSGPHTITVRASDSQGATVEETKNFRVLSAEPGLTIEAPVMGQSFYTGSEVTFSVALDYGLEIDDQSVQWKVRSQDGETERTTSGKSAILEALPSGAYTAVCTVAYGTGESEAISSVDFVVSEDAPTLIITVPVTGAVLEPTGILNFEVQDGNTGSVLDSANVLWYLNGQELAEPSIELESLPSGEHQLRAVADGNELVGGETQFRVNSPPSVEILSVAEDAEIQTDTTIVLNMSYQDETEDLDDAAIQWYLDGEPVGRGAVVPITISVAGSHTLSCSVTDSHGSTGTAVRNITVYDPVILERVEFDNEHGVYVASDASDASAISASAYYSGGISPEATWTLTQAGVSPIVVEGASLTIPASTFERGSLLANFSLTDPAAAGVERSFELEIVDTSRAILLEPVEGTSFLIGDASVARLDVVGSHNGTPVWTLNGESLSPVSLEENQDGGVTTYLADFGASLAADAGSKELSVTVDALSGSTSDRVSFTVIEKSAVQITEFVDRVDLRDPDSESAIFAAEYRGVEAADSSLPSISWMSNLQGVIGGGAEVRVEEMALVAGHHTITIEATASGQDAVYDSVELTVLGDMTTNVISPAPGNVFLNTVDIPFSVTAVDRDNQPVPEEKIIWVSSVDGVIGTGSSFATSSLSDGTHQLQLTIISKYNAIRKASFGIEVRPPAVDGTEDSQSTDDDADQSDDTATATEPPPDEEPQDTFDSGEPIAEPVSFDELFSANEPIGIVAAVERSVEVDAGGFSSEVSVGDTIYSEDVITIGFRSRITLFMLIDEGPSEITLDRRGSYEWTGGEFVQ